MKRILFTVTNDLNYDQRMQRICTALADAGYQVTLTGRRRNTSPPLRKKPFKQKRLPCFFEKGKLFYLEYNLRLLLYLLFKPAHIICAIDLDTILPCLIVAKLRGKKLVYDAHEYFTEVPEVLHRPGVQKAWRKLADFTIPKADLCYTVSASLAEEFKKIYGKDFSLIRNVPLLQDAPPDFSIPEDKFILYQGALNKGRGLEQLIDALQRLPLKLYLAGEGDLSADLRKRVASLGLENKVRFLGFTEPEALKQLTPQAYIGYNLLEVESKSYYFSLSNKFFDYMHALVPSLSNPLPEYETVVNEYKVGVLTNLSVENIVLCISNLLQTPRLYLELKRNCAIAREEFNWQKEAEKLVSLYGDL